MSGSARVLLRRVAATVAAKSLVAGCGRKAVGAPSQLLTPSRRWYAAAVTTPDYIFRMVGD